MNGLDGSWLLQAGVPVSMLELPVLVRGAVAFALVLLLGAGFLWRYEALVERTIRSSTARPLSSLGYGIAGHLAILFFSFYAVSQLRQITISGFTLDSIGLLAGGFVLALFAALGFTVVGTAVVEFRWGRRPWYGLLLGAFAAGLAAIADPLVGGLVWLVIVSTGIGGPVRNWFNSAEDVQSAG